ncbi:hypothetical protein HDV00_007036 [Rhizophlyctis rosea]|nr:hypothetical protein HDV00_007036 [Rhizophlyctis rosea]
MPGVTTVDPNILARIPMTVPHRKGNWIEESVLREQQVREYMEKARKDTAGHRHRDGSQQADSSSQSHHAGGTIIKNASTNGALSILGPIPSFPANPIPLTTSRTSNTAFRLVRCTDHEQGGEGDGKVRYGERVFVLWDGGECPLYLYSEPKSFMLTSKVGKRQTAVLGPDADYRAVWELQWADANMRMEMEGSVVDPSKPVILRHVHTGSCLSTDPNDIIRTASGIEYEVACHSYRDFGTRKEDDPRNHWRLG